MTALLSPRPESGDTNSNEVSYSTEMLLATKYYPLNAEQVKRALHFGKSDTEIQDIQKRMLAGRSILNILNKSVYKEVFRYLESLYYDAFIIPQDQQICFDPSFRRIIQQLNNELFIDSSYQESYRYTAMYYLHHSEMLTNEELREQLEKYRFMLALLNAWLSIPSDHGLYGNIPDITFCKNATPTYQDTFMMYTLSIPGEELKKKYRELRGDKKFFAYYPVIEAGKVTLRLSIINGAEIEEKEIPDIYSSISLRGDSTRYIEEICILGTPEVLTIVPYDHELIPFIDKHWRYFRDNPGACPWEAGVNYINSRLRQEAKIRSKRLKGAGVQLDTPSAVQWRIKRPRQVSAEDETTKKPVLHTNIEHLIRSNAIRSKSAKEIVINIPLDGILNVRVTVNGKEETYIFSRDEAMSSLPVFESNTDATYTFSYERDGSMPENDTIITIKPKNKSTGDATTKPKSTIPGKIEEVLQRKTGAENDKPNSSELDETALAIELIEQIELGKVMLSKRDIATIVGVFERQDQQSAVTFVYKISDQSLQINGCSSYTQSEIQDDIMLYIQRYLQEEQESINTRISDKLKGIQRELSTRSALLQQLTSTDLDISPEGYRILGRYSGINWLIGSSSKESFDEIIKQLREVGVHIQFKRILENELYISVSLEGESHISGGIISKHSSPYYEFMNFDEKISNTHKQLLENTIRNLLMLLGLAGKMKYEQMSTESRKKSSTTQVSIDDILTGKKRTIHRKWSEYNPTDKRLMLQALTRLKRGEGREIIEGGYNDNSYYSCVIEGHKKLDEIMENKNSMIILCDEKITTVPDGGRGHPYIYDMLRENTRLRKYWILKFIATISGKNWKGKRPFTNGLLTLFTKMWEPMSDETKREFLEKGINAAGNLLEFHIDHKGKSFIREFIDRAEQQGIQLRYNRPYTVSLEELLQHKNDIEKIDSTNTGDDLDE